MTAGLRRWGHTGTAGTKPSLTNRHSHAEHRSGSILDDVPLMPPSLL